MSGRSRSLRPLGGLARGLVLGLTLWSSGASTTATANPTANIPLSIIDDRHRTIVLAHPPRRIITLLPSLSESLCVLEACDRLVATDRYADWPEQIRRLPKVGGIDDTPIETVLALHPDVVLAARSSRAIGRLEELGVKVIALEPTSLADMHRVLTTLAYLVGEPARGEARWRQLESALSAAADRIPPALRGQTVYFEVSDAPHAASISSFVGEVLARLGLNNIVPGRLGPFPQINPEFVVRAQPQLIMTSADALDGMRSRPGWNQLTALKTHRTCGFEREPWNIMLRPGPRLGEASAFIANCLVRLSPQ